MYMSTSWTLTLISSALKPVTETLPSRESASMGLLKRNQTP